KGTCRPPPAAGNSVLPWTFSAQAAVLSAPAGSVPAALPVLSGGTCGAGAPAPRKAEPVRPLTAEQAPQAAAVPQGMDGTARFSFLPVSLAGAPRLPRKARGIRKIQRTYPYE